MKKESIISFLIRVIGRSALSSWKINVCVAYLMTVNEVIYLYLDHAAVFAFSTQKHLSCTSHTHTYMLSLCVARYRCQSKSHASVCVCVWTAIRLFLSIKCLFFMSTNHTLTHSAVWFHETSNRKIKWNGKQLLVYWLRVALLCMLFSFFLSLSLYRFLTAAVAVIIIIIHGAISLKMIVHRKHMCMYARNVHVKAHMRHNEFGFLFMNLKIHVHTTLLNKSP